ncbi:MAG: hypothetical protein IKJ23_06630 [Bacteroidaceae bacterium]|nr:hypothetical protein [Bacteroidaceae bacterium]
MKINANVSGTRTIEVNEVQLQIIRKYSLLDRIANSMGIIDEDSLNKLRLTVRSLIASQTMASKELLELCMVLYHEDMKAVGLNNLAKLYTEWLNKEVAAEAEEKDNAEQENN